MTKISQIATQETSSVPDTAVLEGEYTAGGSFKVLFSLVKSTLKTYFDAVTTTLTNKRITRRLVVVTQAAAPAINTDNGDIFEITGLAQAITSLTTNLTGTPTNHQMFLLEITDDGTARAITPGASFAGTLNNPITSLTTLANKKLTLLWKYSSSLSKWELYGRDQAL